MKIIFFGNADFGLNALNDLILSSKHEVVGVVTNKDKKNGRSQNSHPSSVKKFALEKQLNLIEVDNLLDEDFISRIKNLNADLFLVIAYKIIPEKLYSIPPHGAINMHASLLPQYKGAAPIQRAIIDGQRKTGLSSFFINNSIDGGELIYQEEVNISEDDTFEDLWRKLSDKGGNFIIKTLELIRRNKTELLDNVDSLKTAYAHKIDKKELLIDWNESPNIIYNKIRAFSPYPCMYTKYNRRRVKIISSKLIDRDIFLDGDVGSIFIDEDNLFVKCNESFIQILQLMPESKRAMDSREFINGFLNNLKAEDFKVFNNE